MSTNVKVGIGLVLIVLVGLWASGSMDKPLSSVGLNKNPCVTNAFGATFCGSDAKRVCREFGGPACKDMGLPVKGNVERSIDKQVKSSQQDMDAYTKCIAASTTLDEMDLCK